MEVEEWSGLVIIPKEMGHSTGATICYPQVGEVELELNESVMALKQEACACAEVPRLPLSHHVMPCVAKSKLPHYLQGQRPPPFGLLLSTSSGRVSVQTQLTGISLPRMPPEGTIRAGSISPV